ncbi:MAG: deoxyribodipyrimidine photolyase [Microbacteriaceae bacterium]|nr:deoxyribodipyrimidine photolyase [Microbacteriaceae bacterium]
MEHKPIDLSSEALGIIAREFDGLYSGELGLSSIPGGQTAADRALAELDIAGYARMRSEVLPRVRRGASVLSPYIRHNLLTLDRVYRAVTDAPPYDRDKYRDELLWQEYARHLYARIGTRLFDNLRFEANRDSPGAGWNREMRCVDEVVSELETDGWLVNQTRMWLSSHWTVRNDIGWLHGQDRMYRELIDGSRAANLLGWQWTVGAGTGKPYGFARWQVEKRAPGLCTKCPLNTACPIQQFPDDTAPRQVSTEPLLDHDPSIYATAGPSEAVIRQRPDYVLLTVDSLGDADPALTANPDLPVVFVFNASALSKLQLSARRIGFYLETLADLAERRDLRAFLGDPYQFARENNVAVTFAPVPSFTAMPDVAELHPFPWLRAPHSGSVRSFSSWRKNLGR